MNKDSPTVDQDIQAISLIIAQAKVDITDGRDVNLEPVETGIRDVCSAIRDLPPERAGEMIEKVTGLLKNLDELAGELTRQHQRTE